MTISNGLFFFRKEDIKSIDEGDTATFNFSLLSNSYR